METKQKLVVLVYAVRTVLINCVFNSSDKNELHQKFLVGAKKKTTRLFSYFLVNFFSHIIIWYVRTVEMCTVFFLLLWNELPFSALKRTIFYSTNHFLLSTELHFFAIRTSFFSCHSNFIFFGLIQMRTILYSNVPTAVFIFRFFWKRHTHFVFPALVNVYNLHFLHKLATMCAIVLKTHTNFKYFWWQYANNPS